ncbi:MAG: OmpA family protein [Pseudomonadota bacterium]
MSKICLLAVLSFAFVPTKAASLTASECFEVEQKYGIISDLCEQLIEPKDVPETQKKPTVEAADVNGPAVKGPLPPADLKSRRVTQKQKEDNVFFPSGGTDLDSEAVRQVERVGAVLNTSIFEGTCIQLIGHSDSSGNEDTNLEIAMKRAQGVARRLSILISPQRIENVLSMGETKPLTNIVPSNRFQRRVEIRVRRCPA